MADDWTRVASHLGIEVSAERLQPAAAALREDPMGAWAEARRTLLAAGAPVHAVRRVLFALLGIVMDRDPEAAEQAAPALALVAGASSLAALAPTQRFAERLHDGPLQEAIALQFRLRQHPDYQELHAELDALVESLRGVIADADDRPAMTLQARLDAAASGCRWARVTVDCRIPAALDEDIADLAFRIVNESLANLRHAGATRATVTVGTVGDGLRIGVEDDGDGFETAAAVISRPGHLGLPWLQRAVAAAGGRMRVRSAPGTGTSITADLPLAVRPAVHDGLAASLSA